APPTSNGFRARIWSNSTSRRPALSGDSVASAVLRSSISLTPAPRRRYFALLPFRNTGLRLRHLMTTPGCAQRPTHLLAALLPFRRRYSTRAFFLPKSVSAGEPDG